MRNKALRPLPMRSPQPACPERQSAGHNSQTPSSVCCPHLALHACFWEAHEWGRLVTLEASITG